MKRLASAFLAVCLLVITGLAQTSTGSLVGTVSSPDGLIPGAKVVVTDNATGQERTVTTNDGGAFSVPQLNAGTYTVTVSAAGFGNYTANELKIDVGREYSINAALEVGGVAESVTVTAGADAINSTTAELSSTISPRQVLELPLNGRNPLSLVGLQAGAAPNRGNGSEIINGGRTSSTNFTRDGINVQDIFIRNGFVPDTPTVDNTGEFTVTTQNAGAEQGYGSSQIQLVTPRGGQDFHGALFAYNRNSRFAANNYFNNSQGQFVSTDTAVIQGRATAGDLRAPRPFLNRNQFGGKLGGPLPLPGFGEGGPVVVKNKAFFFFSYEKFILRQQTVKTTTVLRDAARTGIFSYRPTGTPAAGQCITFTNGICTVNVLSGAGLTGTIPGSSLGALSLDPTVNSRLISGLPAGNRPDIGDGLNTIGYGFNQSDPEDRREFTLRLDGNINSRNSVSGVFRYNTTTDARTDIDTTFNPTALANTDAPVKFFTVSWVSSPTSNLNNELRFGLQYAQVAFINDVLPTQPFLIGGVPLITSPELNFRDQGRDTNTNSLLDNAAYAWGNHTTRFGGSFQSFKVLSFSQAGVGVPTYTISTTGNSSTPRLPTNANLFPGGISTADQNTADALRYLLGGVVGGGSAAANVTSRTSGFVPGVALDRRLRYETFAGYVGDQWRVTPSLTLNFGLRYEYYTSLRTTDGLYLEPVLSNDAVGSVLNPNGTYDFVGRNSGTDGDFVRPDKDNFAPNFSAAYIPRGFIFGESGRTVLRGGFRISYVNDEYIRSIDNAVGQNGGLTATANSVQTVNGTATTLLNARFNALPAPVAPTFLTPPRTYADNNTAAFAGRFGTVFGVDPKLQISRVFEYNVGIQQEIGFKTVLEVRYVGSHSNQLVRTVDYNQIDIRNNGFLNDFVRALNNNTVSGSITGNTACLANGTCQPLTVIPNLAAAGRTTVQSQITLGTPADLALTLIQAGNTGTVRFLPNPNTGVGNLVQNGGRFRYNAFQAELRRRFSDGFYFQANYTFQKTLTDVTDDGINQTRVAPYLDNANRTLDYARAPYDTPQFFNFSGIYELPFGKDKRFLNGGGLLNQIVGGWQVGSIVQLAAGTPLSFLDARGTLNRAGRSANQTATTTITNQQLQDLIRINVAANGVVYLIDPSIISPTTGRAANGFGSTAFTGQVLFNNNPGSIGNSGRYIVYGPRYYNWDASVLKNFRITETSRLQLRAEAFNVTNSTRFFVGPNSGILNVNSATFGRLTSTYSPRILQFAARFEF